MRRHLLDRVVRDERGAETTEFALVAPIALLFIFALISLLLALAANLSLSHAVSVGARYAAIPHDPVDGVYPTTEEVGAKVYGSTPFFSEEACETEVDGDEVENAPVTLIVACDFPNPLGATLNVMRGLFFSGSGADQPDAYQMTAEARSRRE